MNIAAHVANMASDYAEAFRAAALKWVESDGRARKLEEMKGPFLARLAKDLGGPVTAAERDAKASQEFADYLTEMGQARTQANREWVEMEYRMIKFYQRYGVRGLRDLLSGDAT